MSATSDLPKEQALKLARPAACQDEAGRLIPAKCITPGMANG